LKSIFFPILCLSVFFSASAFSKVLVYEYGLEGDGDNHGLLVTQIACRNLDVECETFYSAELSSEDLLIIDRDLSPGDVINMSFAFQRPEQPSSGPFTRNYRGGEASQDPQQVYREALEKFEEDRDLFETVINDNPESLFVAAAGNGFSMMGMSTQGVPLDIYKVFPAFMDLENLITVSSLDDTSVDVQRRRDYRIMDYANYSINLVDVAAPVELTDSGESLRGTSFAAPYVARISKQIVESYNFSPSLVKSILLKSAFIENLDRTIELSREYVENRRDSIIDRIQNERTRREREEMRAEIADVMLIKSGGALVSSVALTCAENYYQASGVMTVAQACLMAHEIELSADQERLSKLRDFWEIRNIL
jgi:hypothetical protein